ncbi:MAG: membrane integrity-associated transporter subunit PqiC [Candidatus Synoicihabitans palmerolidicus]|nr:membrane integrity-associated transporter subunit PqiC [Candidatus Synoicihabitans palmerolidicus]
MTSRAHLLLLASAALLLTSSCSIIPEASSDPTRFFVLEDLAASTALDAPANDGVTLGLLPIEVTAYLVDSRAIAVTTSANEVTFRNFDRWAEPLDEGIARVLRTALSRQVSVKQVLVPPFPLTPARDYDLSIRLSECTGLQSGSIRYSLAFALTRPDGTLFKQGSFLRDDTPWSGESDDLARLLSQATASAAQSIAAELP